MPRATRKPGPFAAFWRKGRNAETAIHVKGGRIVVRGDAATDARVGQLLTRAVANGTARVECK